MIPGKRVLLVTPRAFPYTGGIETHIHEISKRLSRTDLEITLLTTDPSRTLPADEVVDGVRVLRVPAWPVKSDFYFAPHIYSIIRRGRWDLVHVQGYHTFVPVLAMLAAWRAKIPYVVTFHSGGHDSRLRNAIRGLQKMLLRPLLSRAQRLIAMSRFEAESFQQGLHLSDESFAIIPNGSDLPKITVEPVSPPRDTLILSIGRLERYKGHHRVIEAFGKVLKECPDAQLRILGSGPYEAELTQIVRSMNLDAKVQIGAIAGQDRMGMTQLVSQASLVTLLSEYESQGIAVWEALSLKRPVLVAQTSALAELAERGLARAIPLSSSADEIAQAMLDQLRSPLVPPDVELPTWDKCAGSLLELYETIFARHRQSTAHQSQKEEPVNLQNEYEIAGFEPIRIMQVELSQPLLDIEPATAVNGRVYTRARTLVRLHTQPLGFFQLDLNTDGSLTADEYARRIWQNLAVEINEHLRADGLPTVDGLSPEGIPGPDMPWCAEVRAARIQDTPMMISAVIPTRDRAEHLQRCVDSILDNVEYDNYEIIIVDNAPATSATADLVWQRYADNPRVRYVVEGLAGVSRARNRGAAEARGEIIAFADDDVIVDRYWLAEIASEFASSPRVSALNGLVLPAEIEAPSQAFFEQDLRGFSKGFERLVFDMAENRRKNLFYPYSSGIFGVSASMAVRQDVYRALDGFSSQLGPGTPAGAGDDLDFYFRLVISGYQLVYQPNVVAHHVHRRDFASLHKQLYNYGLSFTAYLTKTLLDDPRRIPGLLLKAPYGLYLMLSPKSVHHKSKTSAYPKALTRLEQKGWLRGPFAYFRSRRAAARQDASVKAEPTVAQPIRAGSNGHATTVSSNGPAISLSSNGHSVSASSNGHHAVLQPFPFEHDPGLAQIDISQVKPVRLIEVELSEPLPSVSPIDPRSGLPYPRAQSLVRLHTHPIGLVEFDLGTEGLTPAEYAFVIWSHLKTAINAHLRQDGLPMIGTLSEDGITSATTPNCVLERQALLADAPLVSVVVPTRERPDGLEKCLDSILAMDYPNFEVLVVDNAPSTNATLSLVTAKYEAIPNIRYIREDHPGVSYARNRGAAEARGEIVAFADDDVRVDKHWLTGIVRGFSTGPDVACVTGMVLTAELDTPAQIWFDDISGFPKRFEQRLYDMQKNKLKSRFYPYSAGVLGIGGNMAVKKSVFNRLGGFYVGLGPGTITLGGGEDLDLYFRLLMDGHQLAYESTAIVRHVHRREYAQLRRQMYGYGVGLIAYLTKCMLDDPRRMLRFALIVPFGMYQLLAAKSVKNVKKQADYPKELTRLEQKGWLHGPFAYLNSRRVVARAQTTAEIQPSPEEMRQPVQV